ncbi:recombinase RecA [bacterium]|nr:recombinase RecA [bacterium]
MRAHLAELALATAFARTEQRWGKGAILRLDSAPLAIDSLPTGIMALDHAIGIGGLPKGRPIEIYGAESCGKTTLALELMAETQRRGGTCAFIDAEHGFDATYAQAVGVRLSGLLLAQPRSGEEGLDIVTELVMSGAVDLIVIDSVAALAPRIEMDGGDGDELTGAHARMMSQALRRIMTALGKSKAVVVFINQVRENLSNRQWGMPKETTTGGRALKFYSSVRIELRRTEVLKKGGQPYGNVVKAKVVKNKVAPPFREAQFEIHFGRGVCKESGLLDLGLEHGLVTQHGSWFAFGGTQLGQGREAARSLLASQPAVRERLEAQLRQRLQGVVASPVEPPTTQQ